MKLGKKLSQTWQRVLLITAIFSQILIFNRCTEKPMSVGAGLLPDDESIVVYDTIIPVDLITVPGIDLRESVFEDKSLLGSINKSDIGSFEAGFLSNFIYTTEPVFKDETDQNNIELVELKLQLVYTDVIGSLNEVGFEVYELKEPVPAYDSSDYTVLPHMFETSPIATASSISNFNQTSISDDGSDTAYIDFSNEYAQQLIDVNTIKTDIYDSDSSDLFQSTFKGFYFKAIAQSSGNGGVIEIDHENTRLQLVVNHTSEGVVTTDTSYFYLGYSSSEIDEGGTHLNLYKHTNSQYIEQALNVTAYNAAAYLSSPAGTRVLMNIPGIEELKDELNGKVSVNRAELILPYNAELNNNSDIPIAYQLGVYDSESHASIVDDALEGYLNGALNETDHQYLLNLGNHMQSYLSGSDSEASNSFYIFISNSSATTSTEGRDLEYVILNGSSAEDIPYLRIVYSKIP